jgi:hypothetical protein
MIASIDVDRDETREAAVTMMIMIIKKSAILERLAMSMTNARRYGYTVPEILLTLLLAALDSSFYLGSFVLSDSAFSRCLGA